MINEKLEKKRHSSNDAEAKLFIDEFMNHSDEVYKRKLRLKHIFFESLINLYHAYIVTDHNELYMYDYDEKIYRNDDKILRNLYRKVLQKIPTNSQITNIKLNLIFDSDDDRFVLTKDDYHGEDNSEFFKQLIPVQNGVINRQTKELIDYDITLFFKNKLDITYQPDVVYPDNIYNINEFILNAANHDKNKYDDLLRLINYALTGYNYQHKLILFLGEFESGKIIFSQLLKSMVGTLNSSNLFLKQFNNDQYLSSLNNKLINVGYDLDPSSKIKKLSQLAHLVKGKGVEYRAKYQRRHSFLKSNKLIIQNVTELPEFDQNDDYYKDIMEAIEIYQFKNNFMNFNQTSSPIELEKMIENQDVKSYLLNQLLDLKVEL